jgi:hypothetical protein
MGNEGPCDAALGIVDAHGDYYLSLRPLFLGWGNVVVGSVESLGRRNGEVLRRRISG